MLGDAAEKVAPIDAQPPSQSLARGQALVRPLRDEKKLPVGRNLYININLYKLCDGDDGIRTA